MIKLEILKTLSIDLSGKQNAPVVYAVQGEKNSRKIRFDLFNNGVQWVIDRTASVLISYKKPDGHGGMYDVLDSGESAFEFVENSTNSVIITLAKQVLTTVGNVPLMVSFMVGDKILSTFSISLDVSENPGIDVAESEDYFSLSAAIEAAKKAAEEIIERETFASQEYVNESVEKLRVSVNTELEGIYEDSKTFYVTIATENGVDFSSDKTVDMVIGAYEGGRTVKSMIEIDGENIAIPLIGIIEENTAFYAGYGIYGTYVVISQTDIKVSVFVENLDCGIHPVAKTEDMTQPVGVDELGGLWSVPGRGGSGSGSDGITPHIGNNGNWFIGETDTGMPSRGEVGPTGVHVGPDAPEDDAVHVWVDTDEDSNAELPSGGDGGYYTPVITQTEAGKAEFSWTASKAGMPTVAPQSVTLPQGPQGEKGEPGADGNDGPKGVPGADGKSAYQYALDGGYTGTEEEFAKKLADCSSYTLPIATSDTLGGVKPVAKSDDMTQSVGVDANGGLWTKLGATTGTGGVFKTIADFTTTETVSEIQIPIDTDELVELCHSAKELRVLMHIEKDSSDTTTVDGNIEFGANPGWYAKFATVAKVIPAATTDWQNYSDTYIVAFCDAGQYVPSPVLIAKATQNAAATVEATQVNWISPDISHVSKGHFFYVRGTQNMGAGTRVVLEVAT